MLAALDAAEWRRRKVILRVSWCPLRQPITQYMRFLGTMILLAMFAGAAMATPESATRRRQTLVGENADYFFRY